ncbi:hypothetical protein SeMB42_g01212 [Synchytrium endobioticum]|uniref:Histone deacetylase interacting domain-containing protein n=1 Tax=Synchytrium endobioticum TaxID=286115 RepID=A0A507DNB5_9FUNG|nr:hypothetical protein SeMB42_g01212 [Synchytrium endobioticum]
MISSAAAAAAAAAPPPPPSPQPNSGPPAGQPNGLMDALTYLDMVKHRFQEQPSVYNSFLDIMKDFKSHVIDTPGVIDRVATLFKGHAELITGFNTFLPQGYRIESTNDPLNPIMVWANGDRYTPMELRQQAPPLPPSTGPNPPRPPIQPSMPFYPASSVTSSYPPPPSSTGAYGAYPTMPHAATSAPSTSRGPPGGPRLSASSGGVQMVAAGGAGPQNRGPVEFDHAISYVNKIKNRFAHDADTYKQFLEVLQTYQKEQKPIQEVYAQVRVLFALAPDLLDEFKQFLPDHSQQNQGNRGMMNLTNTANGMGGGTAKQRNAGGPAAAAAAAATAAAKQKQNLKRPAPIHAQQLSYTPLPMTNAPSAPAKKKAKTGGRDKPNMMEEMEFFDKVKKHIGNRANYTEFLKILNLYSQEILDANTLVDKVKPFLDTQPELFEWFKRFVRLDENDGSAQYNMSSERRHIELRDLPKSGHSYRLLPPDFERPVASSIDDIGRETLNDHLVSVPQYDSERGFTAHRKTIYEEALYRVEEERYEFDLNIEANFHTIILLDGISKQLEQMSSDERAKFQLQPGLGGTSTTIYQRVIKKIWDTDRGKEMIDALHHNPAVALPVILKRLKQKDEEWKKAQRDWQKVWRELDNKNFYKSLDHRGLSFKTTDKKAITSRQFLTEIENEYKKRTDARPYQFEYTFPDHHLHKDIVRLIARLIARQARLSNLPEDEVASMRKFYRHLLPQFFLMDDLDIEEEYENDADSDTDDDEAGKRNGNGGGGSRDSPAPTSSLRKAVLTRRAPERKNDAMDVDSDNERVNDNGALGTENEADVTVPDVLHSSNRNTSHGAGKPVAKFMNGLEGPGSSVSEKLSHRRRSYPFYANDIFYTFFRLYQLIYSRLLKMKELSRELNTKPPRSEKLNTAAAELGLHPHPPETLPTDGDRFGDLMRLVLSMLAARIDQQDYEDRIRNVYQTSAYPMYTVDKLCLAIAKQIQQITCDSTCLELIKVYEKYAVLPALPPRQDIMYRLSAEQFCQEETSLFKLDYYPTESRLTIQLLGKEDMLGDDAVSPQERWSLYIDRFAQLGTSGESTVTRSEAFLRRNLPEHADNAHLSRQVDARAGLELKICVNSYRIHFMEGTEDYFRRRRPNDKKERDVLRDREASSKGIRSKIFKRWLENRQQDISHALPLEGRAAEYEHNITHMVDEGIEEGESEEGSEEPLSHG